MRHQVDAYSGGKLSQDELRSMTSACQLPTQAFSMPLPFSAQEPAGLEGLQDVVPLNRLLDRGAEAMAKVTPQQVEAAIRGKSCRQA
ncbi:hypothetical protein LTR36_001242 [Oleoguttula mirabilis]|uniref:Uncharacterized protein n=1 Tax=Oleoguttula mirabilis TaxID=1507867 RepID=A0AAV9JN82_9PEZI|nr:hypothetical protein LTR36_001242 [Oleoguttula mirabilis]